MLDRLVQFLSDLDAPAVDTELIRQTLTNLEELFLLVIVGEFNSGKSAFINALLGADVALEGVTPTTDRITILRYSDEPVQRELREGVLERGYPAPFLREIAIVDTPGTNAILRHHEELSRGFVPRSDLVLFVTSADRPYTESERGYLELIRDWGKKIVLVINKVDLLGGEEETAKVRDFVQQGVRSLLDITPPIFLVSARLAKHGKSAQSPLERDALLKVSGFEALERYVFDLLDEEGRVRLKLESPLGVAEQLVERYHLGVNERMKLLEQDFKMAQNVESQLQLYREDMRRDFSARLAEIENVIHNMNDRGDAWFDENIKLGRFFELIRRDEIQARFQREVVGDSVALIDHRVQELIDWMVDRNLKQWRAIMEYVNRRRQAKYDEHLIGEVGGGFEYNRSQLLESVGRTAERVVKDYDHDYEAVQLAESIRGAATQTVAVEVGALGLGAAVVVAASAIALDVTGILAASALAGLGLLILPNRRRKAREEFRQRTDELQARLSETMTRQFETELDRSIERINEAIAPYTRFVRTEHARLTEARANLDGIRHEVAELRAEIGAPRVTAT
ncbi:MAG: dynamin family protein [Chloroflexota bacterium]|nr:dynamin family protein [Chloroflexota bacterium]